MFVRNAHRLAFAAVRAPAGRRFFASGARPRHYLRRAAGFKPVVTTTRLPGDRFPAAVRAPAGRFYSSGADKLPPSSSDRAGLNEKQVEELTLKVAQLAGTFERGHKTLVRWIRLAQGLSVVALTSLLFLIDNLRDRVLKLIGSTESRFEEMAKLIKEKGEESSKGEEAQAGR